ncbi:MAG: hypothetical protein KDK39_18205 [Leptospiraceae bacterium]|nr:hypothetical protein [Leptospiraceae bacterium]
MNSTPRRFKQFQSGAVYDLAILVFGFLAPWFFQDITDHPGRWGLTAGILQITAVLMQIPGAWLKRRALQSRLIEVAKQEQSAALRSGNLVYLLLLLHWCTTLAVTATGMTFVPALDGVSAIITVVSIASLTTFFVGLAATAPDTDRLDPPLQTRDRHREWIGSALLILSAIMIFNLWWQPFVQEIASGEGHIQREATSSIAGLVIYTFVLFVPFVMFYIVPRLLFFVEDAGDRLAWLRFGVLYLLSVWQMFAPVWLQKQITLAEQLVVWVLVASV